MTEPKITYATDPATAPDPARAEAWLAGYRFGLLHSGSVLMKRPILFTLQRDMYEGDEPTPAVVAYGVVFPDGAVATRHTETARTCTWDRIEDVSAVHGSTRVVPADDPGGQLARIAQAHHKAVDQHGGTDGDCAECSHWWPCPTYVWATTERDPLLCWDPADDDEGEATE